MGPITIIGEGSVNVQTTKDVVYPDPSNPQAVSGWHKEYHVVAVPADGWIFDRFEFTCDGEYYYGGQQIPYHYDDTSVSPWDPYEEDCQINSGTEELPVLTHWANAYSNIRAIFRHATHTVTVYVKPDEANAAGCTALSEEGSSSSTKGGVPFSIVHFKFIATPANGWRLYGWRVPGGTCADKRKKIIEFDRQLGDGDTSSELEAVFKKTDGMPMCKQFSGSMTLDIVCRASSGEIFGNF